MKAPEQGRVVTVREPYGSAFCLHVSFVADASTLKAVAHWSAPLDVVLERVVVKEYDSAGTFDVTLYNPDGADMFLGLGVGLTGGTTSEVPIVANLGSNRRGRVQTMGAPHELYIDGGATAVRGTLDLYCLDPRGTE